MTIWSSLPHFQFLSFSAALIFDFFDFARVFGGKCRSDICRRSSDFRQIKALFLRLFTSLTRCEFATKPAADFICTHTDACKTEQNKANTIKSNFNLHNLVHSANNMICIKWYWILLYSNLLLYITQFQAIMTWIRKSSRTKIVGFNLIKNIVKPVDIDSVTACIEYHVRQSYWHTHTPLLSIQRIFLIWTMFCLVKLHDFGLRQPKQ